MAFTDSEAGYVDTVIEHAKTYLDSAPGFVDVQVDALRAVDFWTIVAGVRVPLWPRGGLSEAQRRAALVWGEFFPDETTTGVYDESVLEVVTGNQSFATPGEVIENKWFRGRVSITTSGVRFRNCRFTGPAGSSAGDGVVVATHAAVSNLLFEDCEIYPEFMTDITNCINGHDFTLRRCNLHHGVDLVGAIGQMSSDWVNVTIEGSWLHTMVMFNTTSQSDNITHNDLIQWHGLKGVRLLGARMEAFVDPAIGCASDPPVRNGSNWLVSGNPHYPGRWGFSAVMGSPARKFMGDFEARKCWIDGGAVGINFGGPATELFPDGGIVEDCWFGTDFRVGADFGVLTKSAQSMAISGNHRWNKADPFDTSTPFYPRKNG